LVVYVYLTVLVPNFLQPILGTLPTAVIVIFGLFLVFNVFYWTAIYWWRWHNWTRIDLE
jgi:hypothetical protein